MTNWLKLPAPDPSYQMWGCAHGAWQYIMTFDGKRWAVTAKPLGNKGSRVDLGWNYRSRQTAERAVQRYQRKKMI